MGIGEQLSLKSGAAGGKNCIEINWLLRQYASHKNFQLYIK